MQVNDTKSFQEYVFEKLTFQAVSQNDCTLYTNLHHPEYGSCYIYQREGLYELGIADYTIPEDFSVHFHNNNRQLRFGTMLGGQTHFKLEDAPASSFLPSAFLVMEEKIKGQQVWKAGEHLSGIEITIYEPYLKDFVRPIFPDTFTLDCFMPNHTFHFLPPELLRIISRLHELHTQKKLTPMLLEALILECTAALHQHISVEQSVFAKKIQPEYISIGSNRFITIHEDDKKAVLLAHDILSESFRNPPTIQELSERVMLPPQKLKYAFSAQYHTSIYDYTLSLKMAHAAMLLSTTSMSIDAIANEIGYHYSGNFIQAFKKTYGQTPLKFRRSIKD